MGSHSSVTNQVPNLRLNQSSFPELCPITAAIAKLSVASGAETRGAVYTKKEVVEFILDLVGYRSDRPLASLRLLEPSFGAGDFLLVAVERLLDAWRASSNSSENPRLLGRCIRAVELHEETFHATRHRLLEVLCAAEIELAAATALVNEWLLFGDYLLVELDGATFDFVVGNPPYVRQELIPDVLLAEYRARYSTVYDRADLYVPFIERSLLALAHNGKLGFICADRWMKNRYGGPLRRLVAERFHLHVYVDMVNTDSFHSDVSAYPAITVIGREQPRATRVAHRPVVTSSNLTRLASELTSDVQLDATSVVSEIRSVALGSEPWILDASDETKLLRRLEAEFPTVEEAGCKVGIGVATGADQVFIGRYEQLDVEASRKLPLVMTRDIASGEVNWRGLGIVNPFADGGGLVDLAEFPRLRRYLELHKEGIVGRHCAKKVPANWYRTIDRITPSLATTRKLLIPDIKGDAQVVYEDGQLYPHHNLYFVTSQQWDLRALQAVLMSGIARLFVAAYSTKMRGGYLRFQAQYLRRIHVPLWKDVDVSTREELARAASLREISACDGAVAQLYRLSESERSALVAYGSRDRTRVEQS